MSNLSQKYQRDFKNSKFQNPRIKKEKNALKKKILVVCLFLIFISILSTLIYFLFFPKFQISEVIITGINKISREKFEKIVNDYRNSRNLLIFSNNNYFVFSGKKLQQKIGKSYLLEDIEIKKIYPNIIIIKVIEKNASLVWQTSTQCFNLDDSGVAIEYCDEKSTNFIKIRNLGEQTLKIGEQAINQKTLDYLMQCQEKFKDLISISFFEINPAEKNQITIKTTTGFDVYLNQELTVAEQYYRLFSLFNDQDIKKNLATFQYFDLRFGEKIYYK